MAKVTILVEGDEIQKVRDTQGRGKTHEELNDLLDTAYHDMREVLGLHPVVITFLVTERPVRLGD